MENSVLYKRIERLNHYEQIGKLYFETYNENLNYSQYLYLCKHSHVRLGISDLFTLSAIAEQKQIEKEIQSRTNELGLDEQYFLAEKNNIEIEQALRYVNIPKHRHQFVECVYIMEGSCEHTIDNNSFHQTKGHFTILTGHVEHQVNTSPDSICLGIKIRSDTFLKFNIPNLPLFAIPICFNCGEDQFVHDLILYIYNQQEEHLTYHEDIISNLFQTLLTRCLQKHQDTMQFLYTTSPLQGKMVEIANYMFENYQTITLRALAEHFHYSESYLSNLIHETAGITFTTILSNFKMEQASSLLQKTNLKLNVICDSIGYKDTTQFIRDFKKRYKITPAKYRKQYLAEQSM